MSRHQSGNGRKKMSGRDGNSRNKSYSRGNAPLRGQGGFTKPSASTKETTVHKARPDEIRLNKYIANSGICSRREADMYIATGLVTVNGQVVTEMGHKVKLSDEVRYDGGRINPEKKAYVLLNKPKGFATTTSEGKGKTVMDLVANATTSRIKPIGRLGRNSMGLILFTNDEAIAGKFTNSKKGVARLFHVHLDRNLKLEDLKKIQAGVTVEGNTITVEDISYIDGASKNEIGLKIKNTGNSVIRTLFKHLNYEILSLDCVSIAQLTKKDLPRGRYRHLTEQEINSLLML